MIKILNQYFPGRLFILLATENILILLGIFAAISYHPATVHSAADYPVLFGKALLITVICQFCLYYADIYDLRNIGSRLEICLRVMEALGAAALILALLFYFFPEMRLGAGIVETALLTVVFGILLWRIFIEWLNRAYGAGERILMVGSGNSVQALTRELRGRPDLPLNVLGIVEEDADSSASSLTGLQSMGTLDDL